MLTFKIMDFLGTYLAILGRPCYTKFMAVPNYTYLKLKIPGPRGIITVGGDLRQTQNDGYVSDPRALTHPNSNN